MQPQAPPVDHQPLILVIDSPHAPALDVQQALVQIGYLPLGPVNNLSDALALAQIPTGDQLLEDELSSGSPAEAARLPVAALVVLDIDPTSLAETKAAGAQPGYERIQDRLKIGQVLQHLAGLPVFFLAEDIPAALVEPLALSAAYGLISRPVRPRFLKVGIEMALQGHLSLHPVAEKEITAIATDISAYKQNIEQLRQSLIEKDARLLELHHRTRNNLQIIASLLSLQEDFFDDLSTRKAFQNLRQRLEIIALAHTPRYQASNSSGLDLGAYLSDLIESFTSEQGSFRTSEISTVLSSSVIIQTDIHSLMVPAGIATPCGLVVYELLANALQHGFRDRKTGVVQVWLRQADQAINLGVADEGVGFPDDFDYRRDGRLGLQIVQAVVEYQLRGELICYNQPGLRWEIRFSPGKLPRVGFQG